MKTLIIGDKDRALELQSILPEDVKSEHHIHLNDRLIKDFDLIVDLNFDDGGNNLQYFSSKKKIFLVGAVKQSLAEVTHTFKGNVQCTLIGMNTHPTFINRGKLECSLLNKKDKSKLDKIAKALGWDYILVNDRVGMVTPRVVFMIINEACYTVQEGTATMEDIDTAMKLGTNYPYGPFEWADKIGVRSVYETLEAIYEDTHDSRYKICPLLKTMYLRGESFY